MLTLKQILSQMFTGICFLSVDLTDAYFHIKIAPHRRSFLLFAFESVACQYPDSVSGTHTFTKLMWHSSPETEGSLPASPAEIPGPVPHLGCLKNPQLCQGPGPWKASHLYRTGIDLRLEKGSHGRHLQHRLGSSVHGQTSDWLLVNPGAARAYQLPGNDGSSSGTQGLPARPEGTMSCSVQTTRLW